MNDREGTMTSSPGPIPARTSARCNAVVHDERATPCGAPTRSAKAFSNSATRGPWATQPDVTVSAAAAASSGPSHGRTTGLRAVSAGTLTSRLHQATPPRARIPTCLLYTSDAADDLLCVDLG